MSAGEGNGNKERVMGGQLRLSIATAAITVLLTGPALGQTTEIAKFGPSDPSIVGEYGTSLDVDGGLVVVGAPGSGGNAYVVDLATGQQLQHIVPDDPGNKRFGSSVDVAGQYAVIGASMTDANVPDAGVAYVYDITTGEQIHRLIAANPTGRERFGASVAMDDTRIVVGAPWHDYDDYYIQSGQAYVFDRATGQELFSLSRPTPARSHYFGETVAIHDGLAFVGDYMDEGHYTQEGYYDEWGWYYPPEEITVDRVGSVYVYDLDTGAMVDQLTPPEVIASDFGRAIAINDEWIVIGAPQEAADAGEGEGPFDAAGAVYVFDRQTNELVQKLTVSDPAREDLFGMTLAIEGDQLLATAYLDELPGSGIDRTGAAYLFDLNTGEQLGMFVASDATDTALLGRGVALVDGLAVVGAARADWGDYDRGAAYVFDTVPEPATLGLLALGSLPLLRRRNGS
jgi:outer membrane protein assembly factor BamB